MNLQGIRVLSLDDNAESNRLIADMLKDVAAVFDSVSGSDEALQKIQNEVYDIIFIDYMLADEDGITALSKIHSTHMCDNIPVVVVTEGNAYFSKQNYLNAGFAGYIAKPFTPKALIDTIWYCLELNTGNLMENDENNRILIVDDNEMNLLVAKRILAKQYEVNTVTSGKTAFEYLENNAVDLILLDIRMPEMDGFTFLKIIKENAILRHIPVICLTADNEQESEVKCFELGAVDFITKPFIAEIMRQRIARTLELSRLQKSLQVEVERKTLKLNKRSRQLNRLTIQVMKTLAGTIDAKDKYTNGHSIRVAEYSKMIAERMNMTSQEQEDIYYIGLLHDIGKIGIPDDIINKTSKLTDEEYDIIKTHPVIGAEILKTMSEIPEIVIGAKWHHERYDGKGYPDRLVGENIPRVARIIGVADAYDAMSSKRSYRDVLSQEHVRSEIERCKGTQFDPVFADIMLQIIDGDKEYKLREW